MSDRPARAINRPRTIKKMLVRIASREAGLGQEINSLRPKIRLTNPAIIKNRAIEIF